jgi:hypothetical protein
MVEKKKTKRRVVGSVVKARDGGADYIKIREDLVLKQGQTLRLESGLTYRTQMAKHPPRNSSHTAGKRGCYDLKEIGSVT